MLSRILERFPELEPLLERRRGFETASPATEARAEGEELGGQVMPARRRKPGLRLAWVDEPERSGEISWLEGGTLAVNRAHPAFSRARGPAAERLYLVTALALALARQLETEHDPLGFVSQLLARWGERLAPGDEQHG